MKLLIHIKLNNSEAHEVVSDQWSFYIDYGYVDIRDHDLHFGWAEIKELIIKPLITSTTN